MNKREFIDALNARTAALGEAEQRRLAAYYEEIIDDCVEDGVPEEEAVAALGSPDALLRDLLPDGAAPEPPAGEIVAALRGVNIRVNGADVALRRAALTDGAAAQLQFSDPARFAWRMDGDVLEITENEPESSFELFGMKLAWGTRTIPTVTVALAEALAGGLSASSTGGDLIADGLEIGEAMNLSSRSGDIKLRGCACGGDLRLRSLSGDIELREARCAGMSLSTASGDIEVDRGRADSAFAKSASGDVRFDELESGDRLSVETVSGDIDLARCIASDMQLNAVSGDIEVRLPNTAGQCSINADTRSGRIRLPRKWTPADNATACRVAARTVSGDISVAIVD